METYPKTIEELVQSERAVHEFMELSGPHPVESTSLLCQNISKLTVHIPLFNKEVESK